MKRLFFISLLTSLLSFTACAQEKQQTEAWKIVYDTEVKVLPGAPQSSIEDAQKLNDKSFMAPKKVLLSADLLRINLMYEEINERSIINRYIINRRDSIVYCAKGKNYYQIPYALFIKSTDKMPYRQPLKEIPNAEHYSDSEKTIFGVKAEKLTYHMDNKIGEGKVTVWYAPDLPYWFAQEGLQRMLFPLAKVHLPGLPLKIVLLADNGNPNIKDDDEYLKFITKVVSIKKIPLKESAYYPPDSAKIRSIKDVKKSD